MSLPHGNDTQWSMTGIATSERCDLIPSMQSQMLNKYNNDARYFT